VQRLGCGATSARTVGSRNRSTGSARKNFTPSSLRCRYARSGWRRPPVRNPPR
jgi:hypothetical protein